MEYCWYCGGAQMHETMAACPHCGAARVPPPAPGWTWDAYFSLNGRIGRRAYWRHYVLPLSIGGAAVQTVLAMVHAHGLSALVALLCAVGSLAAGVKRCHDRGRSGWFQLVGLVPVAGWLWVIVELGCLPGEPGPNRFGPDALAHGYGAMPYVFF